MRTLFNLLGPFLNPVRIRRQIIGSGRSDFNALFAQVLKMRRLKHALVVHSHDGLDEFSTAAPADVMELKGGRLRRWVLKPQALKLAQAKTSDYAGGDRHANKKIALGILRGQIHGPKRDVVLLNAAAGLYAGGQARNLREGLRLAQESLEQKQALKTLEQLIRMSNA